MGETKEDARRSSRSYQFSLAFLLLLVVFFWSAMAAFGVWGILVAVYLLLVFGCIRSARAGNLNPLLVLVLLTLFGLVFSMRPAVSAARESARRVMCMNRMKQIALALLNYEAVNGEFPPAYVTDKNGKPMHSWRVLILPYLERQKVYDKYDFTEPWSGPNNRNLAEGVTAFRCPSTSHSSMTNYVVVTGANTLMRGGKSASVNNADLSDTLLLVEVADSDIHWMEPRDLELSEVLSADASKWRAITSHHQEDGFFLHASPGGGNVAFANSYVRYLPGRPIRSDLEALLVANGGKPANVDDLTFASPFMRIHWSNCISLTLFLLSSGVLLRKALRRSAEEPAKNDTEMRTELETANE